MVYRAGLMEETNLKPMPSNDVTLKFRLHDIKLGTVPSRDKDGHHIFSLVNFGDLPSWDVIGPSFELF